MTGRIPRVTKTQALVIRHRRLGDAGRIVTLLTPNRGKLDVVAKGVLRPRSKLAGHLEPATEVDVLLAHGREMDIVTGAQTRNMFIGLRENLDRLSAALYLSELCDRFTVKHIDTQSVYELLYRSLVRLERGDGLHLATRRFELVLLEVTGFRPEWQSCVGCASEIGIDAWSPLNGGVVCTECMRTHPDARPIDVTVLKVLRAIQRGPYEEAARIRLTPKIAADLEQVMHDLMRIISERELKSQEFVAAVRRASPSVTQD